MLDSFVQFVLGLVNDMGYTGIVILMALESSFIPFPSEVVVPPAGYLAAKGEMNLYLVILSGIAGSLIGAVFNYYLAVFLGRPLLEKYGKYLFLPVEKLEKVEKYFNTHGEMTTFAGRLIPVIRQYISFPAGLTNMNMFKFCIYTAAGAGIWVVVLAFTGYFIGNNAELIKENLKVATICTMVVLAVSITIYIKIHRRKNRDVSKTC